MLDKYIRTKSFTYIYTAALLLFAGLLVVLYFGEYKWIDDHAKQGHMLIMIQDQLYTGFTVLIMITAVMLVISSRLSDAMLPAMLFAVLSTVCYNSADKFLSIKFLWVAPFAVFGVIFHFIKYRKPFRIGRSFWGLCAISVALICGGVGTITAGEYFKGTALFYTLGLGLGMMLFYLLIKSQFTEDDKAGVARVLYATGILAAFCILWFYVYNWDYFIRYERVIAPQCGNNLSTFLMLALPFPLYYASRRYMDILAVLFMYAALVFSGSNGGLLMGTAELIILLVAYTVWAGKGRKAWVSRGICISTLAVFGIAAVMLLPKLLEKMGVTDLRSADVSEILHTVWDKLITSNSARMDLLKRMVVDFKHNPIFGVGIGYTGNSDIYNPVKGAMNWYHMWFAQVIGGLGIVGILAYGYQLVDRVRIFIANRSMLHMTCFLSYVGLFLMSQVNPGEFCPVPYAMLAVTYFVMMEKPEDDRPLFRRNKITGN